MTERYLTAAGVTTKVGPDLPHLSIIAPDSVEQFKVVVGKECLINFRLSGETYQAWARVHIVNDFGMAFSVSPDSMSDCTGSYNIPWENIRMVEV